MDKFVADCKKHSIDYGFYWYSYAMSVEQALTEAEKCIEVIKNLSPTYPVFFDMEEKKQISGRVYGHTHKRWRLLSVKR